MGPVGISSGRGPVLLVKETIMDWDDFARPWLDAAPQLEAAHRPVLDALMLAAALKPGERILDVGCGTGPSLLAASKDIGAKGQIVGIDVAPPLLARAAERTSANVTYLTGDAGSYPYPPDMQFDVILSNFGTMFFEDTTAALTHMRSYVPEGGRFVASVWGSPQNNPWFSMPRQIVDGLIADVPRPDPAGPGPMRFGNPQVIASALMTAGWKPLVETLELNLTPPGTPEDVADLHMKMTAGMMLRGMEIDDVDLTKIRQKIASACQQQVLGKRVLVPAEIHIVTATAV